MCENFTKPTRRVSLMPKPSCFEQYLKNVETPRKVKISRFSVKIVKIDLNLAGNQLTLRTDFEVINVRKLYKTIKNMFNEARRVFLIPRTSCFEQYLKKCPNTSKSQKFTIFGENRKNRPQSSRKSVDFEEGF